MTSFFTLDNPILILISIGLIVKLYADYQSKRGFFSSKAPPSNTIPFKPNPMPDEPAVRSTPPQSKTEGATSSVHQPPSFLSSFLSPDTMKKPPFNLKLETQWLILSGSLAVLTYLFDLLSYYQTILLIFPIWIIRGLCKKKRLYNDSLQCEDAHFFMLYKTRILPIYKSYQTKRLQAIAQWTLIPILVNIVIFFVAMIFLALFRSVLSIALIIAFCLIYITNQRLRRWLRDRDDHRNFMIHHDILPLLIDFVEPKFKLAPPKVRGCFSYFNI